jgi:hypothetical protein
LQVDGVNDWQQLLWSEITGGATGTGPGKVTYSVARNNNTFRKDATITVAGLSVANPGAASTIHIPGP